MIPSIAARLSGNPYPGRGLVLGVTPDGRRAAAAYFIMGRSRNSRNRVFAEHDGAVFTEPFDPALVSDPSLIIYAAVRTEGNHLVVTNGNQTDTICDFLKQGKSFEAALATREFEPDAPNYTPRVSGMTTFANGSCVYDMSILKSGDAEGSFCNRFHFSYGAKPGLGHFLHTYVTDGNPIPSFEGEPEPVAIPDSIDELAEAMWAALDADNKISLYVRYTDLATGAAESRLFNKNTK